MTKLILVLALVGQSAPGPDRAAPASTNPPARGAAAPAPAESPSQAPAKTAPAPSAPSPAGPSATAQVAEGPGLPVLTLDEAIREAHQSNLDLQVAQARLDQANEISSKAWAGYLPNLVAQGAYVRNEVQSEFDMGQVVQGLGAALGIPVPPESLAALGPPTVIQPYNQWTGQIQLSQALLVPPLWAAISNAYKAERVARLSTESARRDIMFGVVQLYYGAVGLKQALAVQERLLEATRAHERDARTRVNAGAAPKITLIRAQIDRARSEQDVRRAQFALASAKIALATMLQHHGDFDVAQPPEPQVDTDGKVLEQAALKDRPDVLAAEANVDLAKGQHNGTWLSYLPSIIGNAAYRYANFTGFSNKNYTWAITVAASWTLWDGGLRESQLRETEAKLVEARASARGAEAKAIDEVRRSLLDLESARANRQKAEEQLNLARENMRLVEVNFNSGVATQLDVTDATTALSSAELGAVGERLNSQLAALRLLKAAGAFNP